MNIPRQKVYKVYDIINSRILTSHDVIFHENIFPCQNDSISKNIIHLSCITVDDDVYLKNTVESFIENEILNEISSHTTSYSSSFPINNLMNLWNFHPKALLLTRPFLLLKDL